MSALNKKSPRSFQCRDGLWKTFEEMASELECSVDYLINDAMKQYARQRGYTNEASQTSQSTVGSLPGPTTGALPPPAPLMPGLSAPPLPVPSGAVPSPAPPPPPTGATRPGGHGAPPPPPPPGGASRKPPPLPASASIPPPLPAASSSVPSMAPTGRPPAMPGAPPPPPMVPSKAPPMPGIPPAPGRAAPPPRTVGAPSNQKLTIVFQGQPHPVTKDRFIIGRGKSSSDLTIRDPNVSRQHALVEFSGGNFYMVDMGSTNGIEFSGQRVQRKAIQNGDVFRICDHELYCSMGS